MGRWLGLGALLALATGPAAPGWCDEGVLQISQDSVEAAGGFPFAITEAGSYVLTSDLVVSTAGTTAIVVEADDVTIDLNGFEISGPVTCTGDPVSSCSSSSPDPGIEAFDVSPLDRTVVRNGSVRGFPGNGLDLGDGAVVENVTATENADTGIQVDGDGIIRDCNALRNGMGGVETEDRGIVTRLVARGNGHDGVAVGASSVVSDVVSSDNLRHGVSTANDSTVRGSTTIGNSSDGINAASGATIVDNMSGDNGSCVLCDHCTVRGNTTRNCLTGIDAGEGSSVVGNTVSGGPIGLDIATGTGIGQNVVTTSTPIAVGASGFHEIGTNVCGTNTTCP